MKLFTRQEVKEKPVARSDAARAAGVTLVELIVVVIVALAMIAGLTPFVRMARERARRINCGHNLRKISLGLHAYAADHKDAFPPDLGTLYPDYVEEAEVFDCPASRQVGTKDRPDYNYISGLMETASPRQIIAEDAEGNHRKLGRNVLRVDGSVEWVSSR